MAWTRSEMCKKIAELELKNGLYVNLGIGMPTEVANYIPDGVGITLQSENGILGMGEYPSEAEVDADLINAGKETVTIRNNGSFFDSVESFAMIRGEHIDLTILGALQVTYKGDLANWCIPGKMIKGMGGAMDLVAGAKRVVVMTEHVSKNGDPKIIESCTFPLTGVRVVDRIITDFGVFDCSENALIIKELAYGVTLEQVISQTPVPIINAKNDKAA